MSNGSTCLGGGQSGSSGVGKEIQHLYRPPGISNLFTEPVPVYRLFRKKACMLETKGFQLKG